MSEAAAEKKENIPDESAGKRIPNGGNAAKSREDFELAAIYVSDAQYNRNIYFDTSPQAVRLYLLYHHWILKVLLYFFILLNLSLAVFEEPAVFPLPTWATMLVELFCLFAFSLRIGHYAKVIPRDKFWKDPKNICIIATLVLTLIDMVIYGALKAADCYGVRWSRVLRPLLLVNVTEGRQLRRAFRSIRNALPQIFYVFLLFMFSILLFSLMALKLLGKRDLKTIDGKPYFTNYVDIVFDLYVLVTTANSPDVMMPAYNANFGFAIFFILYILINTYIFMSVFLAVVYNNYKKYLKEEVRQLVKAKRHKMVRAFAVLQEQREEGGPPVVTRNNWNQLIQLVQPNLSSARRQLVWSVCDDKNQGFLDKVAFIQLADLLNIEVITVKPRPHPFQNLLPNFYQSAPSRFVCKVVQHRGFVIVFDLIILVNTIFIGLDEKNPLISNSEWVFLTLYLLEILLKLYVFEPRAFFSRHNFWNWFDTIIVISALIATCVNSALGSTGEYTSRQILDIVFILRVLRLVRVVDNIQRFRTIINTLIRIGPAIFTFGQLIVVVYYIFAVLGMEIFKDKVKFFDDPSDPDKQYCGNPLLKGTAFANLNYCKNNFNNVVSSFVLLVELTVVNQWHVLSSGFVTVTNVSARIFFVIFHITVVIIIINIFVAFVLEAFFLEYSDLQTSLEKKIEELNLAMEQERLEDNLVNAMETIDNNLGTEGSPTPSRSSMVFKISSKRYRTVDALLQRIFEADLAPEDLSENDDTEAQNTGSFSNPSFGSASP
ncbi:two pore segment channel 3 isoform X2 [Oryzias melastigma]|uniref:Two pore segment channel 3 n=2 Tax=Oryzias melastigma TaxID=30732 RepID=A0A3B3CH23_ORYME|nr:two pore segment channel 3 isoform X1 [Oryzias melastigma]XP_024146036.1 two pore segment channel 3 isoform X2 [Oryzias melastigma]